MMRLVLLSVCILAAAAACATSPPNAQPEGAGMTPLTLKAAQTVDAAQVGVYARGEDGVARLKLVQRPCRFVAAEPDKRFDAQQSAEACAAHNAQTLAQRTQQVLRVPAGPVTIEVSSEQIPYEVGFWLRRVDAQGQASAQGGGITAGVTRAYDVTLMPGTYLYNCPLNPTPDYVLIVE